MENKVKVGGIYFHFKGNKYQVLNVARHTETDEEMVVYMRTNHQTLWVRPLSMFLEEVKNSSGETVPRFKLIS